MLDKNILARLTFRHHPYWGNYERSVYTTVLTVIYLVLNDRHYACERHHACAEVSSKPNKKDGDQTCKKVGMLLH